MYVLHHADQPHLYAGLPDTPKISPLVEAWKGVGKYAGMAVIALTAPPLALCITYCRVLHRVSETDEENADRLAGDKS